MRWFVKYLGFGSYAVACFACGSSEPSLEPVAQQVQPIVGGVVDTPQENDAVVMIYAGTSIFGGGLCTGALIAPNVVLTARHCVSKTTEYVDCYQDVISDLDPQTLLIMRGYDAAHNPQGKLAKGKHIVHDGSTSLCGHDLALIVLDKDDVTGETQSQIPIVPLRVRVNKGPEIGEVFTAVGYGLTDPKDMNSSGVRYRRDGVKVLRFVMGTGDADFTGTQSICQGDSGGPAISANHAVIGVTSRGLNCMGDDNIWTRTDRFKALIDEAVRLAGTTYTSEEGKQYDGTPRLELCNDGVCPEGLTCVQGFHGQYCTRSCDLAAPNCASGQTCGDVGAGSGYCFMNEPCSAPEDCAEGLRCVNDGKNYCSPLCGLQGECPVGFSCAPEVGVCFKEKSAGSVYSPPESGGCAYAPVSHSAGWFGLGMLLLMGSASRFRRAKRDDGKRDMGTRVSARRRTI